MRLSTHFSTVHFQLHLTESQSSSSTTTVECLMRQRSAAQLSIMLSTLLATTLITTLPISSLETLGVKIGERVDT